MADLLGLLTEPLRYAFMVRSMVAAVLVGVVCGALGCYVVLRGMAFFGSALSHSILPGIALGYLYTTARGGLFWWGLATGALTALGIGAVSRGSQVKEDTAIGVVFAGMFALGIALISSARSYAVDLSHFLFGHVLGVSGGDLWLIAGFGGGVLLLIGLLYKEFLVLSFDPVLARTLRLPVRALDNLMLVMIAVTIVVSLQTVGVALMVAMLVTPAAAASLLTRRLPAMMALSALIGACSGVAGLYVSYHWSVASGAAIVLVCTATFALAFVLNPRRGWLRRWSRSA